MKAIIKTSAPITEAELDEVKELLDVDFVVEETDELPVPTWNPYFKLIELDWKWHKSLFGRRKADIYCYVGTDDERLRAQITKYRGLYNLTDSDNIHDFWFFKSEKLHKKAKLNGFKSNFAWLFIHEYLHGVQHFAHQRDSVHEMEAQGRLKELLPQSTEASVATKKKYLALLKQLALLLLKLSGRKYQVPLPNHWDNVTQEWLEPNPIYTQTGVHVGVDFAAPVNTPILAPYDGEVTRSSFSGALGYWSEFKFEDKYLIALHLRGRVPLGQRKKGEPIGFVGATGNIRGIHSHLEIWICPRDASLLKSRADVERYTRDITSIV